MEWLNTSVTFLNSAEFLRADETQRGVWLTLAGYCIQQENSGQITGTEHWTDWDWQQVLKVRKRSVKGDSTLWHWEDGHVLILHGYPIEQEALYRKQKKAGRVGGLRSAEARRKATTNDTTSLPSRTPSTSPATKGNGKEGKRKRKVREGTHAPAPRPSSLSEVVTFFASKHMPETEAAKFFHHYEANGWKQGGRAPIQSWHAQGEKWIADTVLPEKSAGGRGAVAPAAFNPEQAHAHTGGVEVAN